MKVIIIGDSFCRSSSDLPKRPNEDYCFWVDSLKSKLNKKNLIGGNYVEVITDAEPSRDAQTIFENWIKLIPKINEDDFLIVCFPSLKRTRLPFDKKDYTRVSSLDKKIDLVTRFVGTPSYHNSYQDLEFWGNSRDWKYFEEKLDHQEIINGSIANQLNFLELVESAFKLTKSEKFIFSWDIMENKSEFINDKELFTEKVGIWETFTDVYNESNGQYGAIDFHWSFKTNKIFSEFIYDLIVNN